MAQEEKLDAAMVQKIRTEGLNNSKVMDIVFYLTEVSGPRLNNSPGYMRAANWAKSELTKYRHWKTPTSNPGATGAKAGNWKSHTSP